MPELSAREEVAKGISVLTAFYFATCGGDAICNPKLHKGTRLEVSFRCIRVLGQIRTLSGVINGIVNGIYYGKMPL